MKKNNYFEGLKFGLGILTIFSILGIVSAVGFHTANEILSGTFNGNYNYQGYILLNGSTQISYRDPIGGTTRQIDVYFNGTDYRHRLGGSGGSAINWHIDSFDNPRFYIQGTTGNVGIGTSSPSQLLHLSQTTTSGNELLLLDGLGGWDASLSLKSVSKEWQISSYGSNDAYPGSFRIKDVNQGLNRFVIKNSNGNIGIGVNDPAQKLDVSGSIRTDGYLYFSSSQCYVVQRASTSCTGGETKLFGGASYSLCGLCN